MKINAMLVALSLAGTAAAAVPNKITYQGRLSQSGVASSGSHTFQACFKAGGGPICAPAKALSLPPSGDFTLTVDVPSGVDFLGAAVQLEISVDGNPLSPADDLVSVPYALVASSAVTAVTAVSATSAQNLTGNVNASQVQLNGTGAFLNAWQSTTTPTMIDAAKVLGLPSVFWTAGTAGAISYSGGNVGIGTSNPNAKLDVLSSPIGADTQLARIATTGSVAGLGYLTIGDNGGGFIGWDYTNLGIAVNAHTAGGAAGGVFIKRIDNGHSNVGIGTTNPTQTLTVNGGFTYAMTQNNVTGSRALGPVYQNTTGRIMYVSIATVGSAAGTTSVVCDGASSPSTVVSAISANAGYGRTSFFIVLPGYYYRAVTDTGGNLSSWIEWY